MSAMISSSSAAMRKQLTALQVSPSLLPLSERIQLLRQSTTPLAPTQASAIYHSLLQTPAFSLDTKIFNSMMSHSLLYHRNSLKDDTSINEVDEDERNREVLDSIMNLLSDMTHLELPHDGTTYSLLIQANLDLTSNKDECITLFREAATTNLALESDSYATVIDLLISKSSLKLPNEAPIGKSSIWEIYSAVKKANVKPSFALFTSLIRAFTHLNAGAQVAKIYSTLHRLGGAHPEIYASKMWPSSLYVAVLNSLAKTRVPIPGGDERVVNRLMYLIRKGDLTMNVEIVGALISFWNSKGKYAAAVRLAGREGKRGVGIDADCYMGLIDSGIGMRDLGVLRDVVMGPVYEGVVNGRCGIDVYASGIHGVVICMLEPAGEVPSMGQREDVNEAEGVSGVLNSSDDQSIGSEESIVETKMEEVSLEAEVVTFDRADIMRLVEGLLGDHEGGSVLYSPVHPVSHQGVSISERVSEEVADNLVRSFAKMLGRERDGELFGRLMVIGRGGEREELVRREFSTGWIESGGVEEDLVTLLSQ